MASYAMLTNVGRNKEAEALANGDPLEISEIAWGDGTRIPAGGETALENEQGRKPVQGQGVTAGALNTAFFEVLLAEDEGPFVIREAGLFDVDGDMIAIAYYDPPVNKPLNTVSAHLRINVIFSDLENLIIRIDASNAFVSVERTLTAGKGLKGGGDLSADRTLAVDFATQAEALAGTRDDKVISPLVVAQALKPPTVTILTSGANATYVTPEGCKAIHVKGVGGGAGGETPSITTSGKDRFGHAGGGGAGFEALLRPDPLQEFTYTIGAGGTGGGFTAGTYGSSGGQTKFGNMTAKGGSNTVVGSTAEASGADINYRGSPGIQYFSAGGSYPQVPGGSIFGPSDSLSNSSGGGQRATVPGTGGAGGLSRGGSFPVDRGEDGADGMIVVTEFY